MTSQGPNVLLMLTNMNMDQMMMPFMAGYRNCKRANPWKNETSSKRQCLKRAGGEVPGESAVLSNGAVPGESAVLSQGAVPGESAAKLASESGEPGASRTRATHHVSAREHYYPGILRKLAPPHCTFMLDQQRHRFYFTFKKVPDVWQDHFEHPRHMSKSFFRNYLPWRAALKQVHKGAWDRWNLVREQDEWKISNPSLVQTPGCIPEDILEVLDEFIQSMNVSATKTYYPGFLRKLAPPHCILILDQQRHRFYFTFKKVPDVWQDHFEHPRHMSKAFQNLPWRDALKQVHKGAWDRWNLVREQDEWKISNPSLVQTPGCIPEDILEVLDEFIQSMNVSATKTYYPGFLRKLAPPHCTFMLDQQRHRFYFTFKKVPDVWQDHFEHPRHMSKAFQNLPWRDALKQVHKGAWDRWNLVREQDEWKISNPSLVQTPGCIPEDILEVLDEFIQSMNVSATKTYYPGFLRKLAPPHCTFMLDQQRHRFYFTFKKVPDVWQDHFEHPRHMSKAFQNLPWRDALKQVHKGAWDRWNLVREQDEWKISNPSLVQTPGCIPEDILEVLDEFIQSIPAPVKYKCIKMA